MYAQEPLFNVPQDMVVCGRGHAPVRGRSVPVVRGRARVVRRHSAFVELCTKNIEYILLKTKLSLNFCDVIVFSVGVTLD